MAIVTDQDDKVHGAAATIVHNDDKITISFEYPAAELHKMMAQGIEIELRRMAKEILVKEGQRLLHQMLTKEVEAQLANRKDWIIEHANNYINKEISHAVETRVTVTIDKALQDLTKRILGR